ncbi:MAG: tRNA (adenosine(37)-N6)-threonylcarbamoyltransferase complex ATPase subunit type 1 TsaE [Bacteroidales bacterium]|nr:tRNA (adenosine(37)-N6)-threonylcarbamoyltransferase complex ATPase subunit type 1 TsaE [Candidatus Cryptobacteroides aphodequi]
MNHSIKVSSLEGIDAAAREFLSLTEGHNLIAFHAPMGAGKTTFTSAICRALGVESDAVSSPTFAIVNEYRAANGEPVFHFDFYRINRLSEALDLGLYEYLDSGYLCLMEWPENIADLLPEQTLMVEIGVADDGSRIISWQD